MSSPGVVKGLFFDLDGTLVDADDALSQAYSNAFADHGHQVAPAAIKVEVRTGDRSDVYIPRLVPGLDAEMVKRIQDAKVEHYGKLQHLVRPNHHLVEFLRLVAPHHVTALVTTARRVSAQRVLNTAGIADLFDHLICGDEVSHGKPNPEVYLKALQVTGLKRDEVVAFEDSPSGLGAAVNAGIKVIKITLPQ